MGLLKEVYSLLTITHTECTRIQSIYSIIPGGGVLFQYHIIHSIHHKVAVCLSVCVSCRHDFRIGLVAKTTQKQSSSSSQKHTISFDVHRCDWLIDSIQQPALQLSKLKMPCFHCGLNDHEILTCPSLLRGEEQSQSGKDAQQAFYDARKVRSWHSNMCVPCVKHLSSIYMCIVRF